MTALPRDDRQTTADSPTPDPTLSEPAAGGTADGERIPGETRRRPELKSLTGLRFVAALLVFFFHASLTDPPQNPFGDPAVSEGYKLLFSKAGWMGVSFFFVLSGFVLTWVSRQGEPAHLFWRRRLLKVFPAHMVTWGLAMILFAATFTTPSQWLPNLLLVHSWFPQHDTYISVNPPSWSLCSELLFYLLFPVIILWVRRIRETRLWAWAAMMVVGMVAVQLVTQFLIPDTPPTPEGFGIGVLQFWFGYNFPPVRLFEFTLGMILARVVAAGRWPGVPGGMATAWVFAGLSYVVALAVPFLYGLNVATIAAVVVLVCTAATRDVAGHRSWLRHPLMTWLGEVSFGFYLAQYVVLYYVRHLMDAQLYSTGTGLAVLLGLFALTMVVGWLVHVLVERPIMRRWARPRTTRVPSPADQDTTSAPAGDDQDPRRYEPAGSAR